MTSHAPSGRVMAGIWLAAVAVAIACAAVLLMLVPPDSAENLDPPPFAVFIGSSLTRFAFPFTSPAGDVFPTATATDRLVQMTGVGRAGRVPLRERLRRAIEAGVKKIYVEIDPLVTTHRVDRVPSYLDAVRRFSDELRQQALAGVRVLFGLARDRPTGDTVDGVYQGDTRELAQFYPATLHPPRNAAALAAVLAEARRKSVEVVWMSPPRSETLARYLGPAYEAEFEARLKEFSEKFGAEVWRPVKFWPNEFFVDHAHLNRAGRARFFAEFRRYAATAR